MQVTSSPWKLDFQKISQPYKFFLTIGNIILKRHSNILSHIRVRPILYLYLQPNSEKIFYILQPKFPQNHNNFVAHFLEIYKFWYCFHTFRNHTFLLFLSTLQTTRNFDYFYSLSVKHYILISFTDVPKQHKFIKRYAPCQKTENVITFREILWNVIGITFKHIIQNRDFNYIYRYVWET